ncbi:MAG: hypothetical protein J0H92_07590 [Sphingobacteriales bacterium]|nr:hypothetical protein [Sphingobacteriales bacterium]OJW37060.1 MAG: hypothetical protein BGO54_13290 [Sphingobacteriales bacterium 46-32]
MSATSPLYALLFCDEPQLYLANQQAPYSFPYNILANGRDSVQLRSLAADTSQESRIRLLAFHQLGQTGQITERKELLGVVVEVALSEGLDVLAAYADGTARFLHHTGRVIIWENGTDSRSRPIIDQLFTESARVVAQIGPWNQPRRPAPAPGMARISFLVADGLYFGEAPLNNLFNDPLAAPALQAATALMQFLTTIQPAE